MTDSLVGKTPQRQDSLLRNSTVSQTGNFRKIVAGTVECNNFRVNHIDVSGELTAIAFHPTGLSGAMEQSRYVGGTTSGAPTTGTFQTGDYIVAQDGPIWVCTSGGSPGTWNSPGSGPFLPLAGGTMTGDIDMGDNYITDCKYLEVHGLTGATEQSRYVGGTTSGAPSSGGPFQVGDYIIAQDGNLFICTVAGSPGVWSGPSGGPFLPLSGGTMSGDINMGATHAVKNASYLSPFGLTAQTQNASRYIGATTSGAPGGTGYSIGDYIIAQNGNIFICTAVSPLTWSAIGTGTFLPLAGGTMSGDINMGATHAVSNASYFSPFGLTAQTQNASRYIGATTSGAPGGTGYSIGDYIIAQNGNIFICTATSPLTWTPVGGAGVYLPLAGGTMSGTINMNTNNITNGGTITASVLNATTQIQLNAARILSSFEANSLSVGLNSLSGTVSGTLNTSVGSSVLVSLTSGSSNVGVGYAALTVNSSGGSNVGVGSRALAANSTASQNTAIGDSALLVNSTGAANTAVGYYALSANSTVSNNTAVGYASLFTNSTGTANTAVGYLALTLNTASNNTGIGHKSLAANSSGASNTAVGYFALSSNSTASNNTAVGYAALLTNVTGASSTAVGYAALVISTGNSNTAVGHGSLAGNTSAASNTAVGYGALATAVVNGSNTAVGYRALASNTGGSNTAMGYNALVANSSGLSNCAFGYQALSSITTNSFSTAVGSFALTLGTGASNTAVGYNCLASCTSGSQHTAMGYNALSSVSTVSNCTSFGYQNLVLNTVANQVGVGAFALQANTTAPSQTAIGYLALGAATTGTGQNTAIGYLAMQTTTTGANNVAIGYNAMGSSNGNLNTAAGYLALVSGGDANVAIGAQALTAATTSANTAVGYQALQTLTTGNSNCALGYLADVKTNSLSNCIILGASGQATASNQLVIHGAGSGTGNLNLGVAGVVTVSNTTVTATSMILLTHTNIGAGQATLGALSVTSRVAGTSFTVTSSNVADTSTFNYMIFEI
jgi:hypothetical protein